MHSSIKLSNTLVLDIGPGEGLLLGEFPSFESQHTAGIRHMSYGSNFFCIAPHSWLVISTTLIAPV